MVSAKPWKTYAVLRLIFSIFLCVLAGALVMAALHYHPKSSAAGLKFYLVMSLGLLFIIIGVILLMSRWRLEGFLWRFAAALVCIYGGLFLGFWAQKMAGGSVPSPSVVQMLVGVLSFQGLALVLVWVFVREHGITVREAFGLPNSLPQAMGLGVMLACLFMPVGWGLQYGSSRIIEWAGNRFPKLGVKPEQQEAVQTLEMAVNWRNRLALGLVTILLVPVAEEVLFRGILYPWIKQAGYPALAWWGTALLFAAMHTNLASFIPLTVLALALAALYERTDNLLAPITTHAVFNGLNFTLLYSAQEMMRHSR
ncbi:MAG TPA: CPBP family intramembrane glutamic endopeptidase [Verrucomicrobiae bacterium]|nr:CPBP family intramembrane glutamic endopeptidase [Verrucomicrobiae bacterium]